MPSVIDVGSPAVNRALTIGYPYTVILKENPANLSGYIRLIHLYAYVTVNIKIGIFQKVNGDTFTTRSFVDLGLLGAGFRLCSEDKDTNPITMEVEVGDYIGFYTPTGYLDKENTGEGYWYFQGARIPCTDQAFSFQVDRTASLFGTSAEVLVSNLTLTELNPTYIGHAAVTTNPATDVGATSATLNGTLDDDGGGACDCGFEWGETEAYGNTTPTQSRTTGQAFAQAITGLTPGTTYHFRAIASGLILTAYGADETLATRPTSMGFPPGFMEILGC